MELTIDKAIKIVSLYDGFHALDLASAIELKKACNVLKDTAKKYQKIEQIIKDKAVRVNAGKISGEYEIKTRYIEICEVVEDGNDD